MSDNPEPPYQSLGKRLRALRQKLQETAADVSGAVEIDEALLARIEQGSERPSEDILMLLITHFGISDDEAANVWQLAGYDLPQNDDDHDHERERTVQDEVNSGRATVLVMAVDPRISYSDSVQVSAGENGVIVNFSQGAGTRHALTTARVGMSREQAYNVMRALQEALQHTEPRQLPSGAPNASSAEPPSASPPANQHEAAKPPRPRRASSSNNSASADKRRASGSADGNA